MCSGAQAFGDLHHSLPCWLRRDLSLNLGLIISLGWLISELQGPLCQCTLPQCGVIGTCGHACGWWGFEFSYPFLTASSLTHSAISSVQRSYFIVFSYFNSHNMNHFVKDCFGSVNDSNFVHFYIWKYTLNTIKKDKCAYLIKTGY